ncbi:hypothetical protein JHK84_032145 [Glycine max]|nr:hypothetical protein JHK85_032579 [Glycine max]KAG4995186.1 hypothetical protein JHK86_032013 [Glycine max]KAG5146602.1 hypothetical protein JHK84_032145 [Glycine max]KAH1160112.1 hypothetical protein GYH30_031741 [Glycine max]
MTPSHGHSESVYYGYGNPSPVEFGMDEEVITEPIDSSRARDSISVTIRFRPLSEIEYHRGDKIAWYADGDKIVCKEYNPATAYAFGIFISNFGTYVEGMKEEVVLSPGHALSFIAAGEG